MLCGFQQAYVGPATSSAPIAQRGDEARFVLHENQVLYSKPEMSLLQLPNSAVAAYDASTRAVNVSDLTAASAVMCLWSGL